MTPNVTATSERIAGPDPARVEMLNVDGVAEMLDCSARHVYRLVESQKMPAPVKLGALVRWRRGEINTWIAAGCPSVSGEKGGA